jgi:signal transduction histidine kinase
MISNALKFTTKGFIMVSFSLLDDEIEISNELLNNVSDV